MDHDRPQQSVALTGSDSRSGKGRRIFQIVVGVLSWIGFVLLWIWQLEVYIPSTWLYSVCLIALIFVVWTAITIVWVRWNQNIYSRRHRRTKPAKIEVAMDEDTLGRPIVAPGGIRAAEGQIFISVDASGAKRYDRARRRLPRAPKLPPAPDRSPVPAMRERVAAIVNGNGAGRVPVPVPVNGNGNGHVPNVVPVPVPVAANGYGNGNGHVPAPVLAPLPVPVATNGNGNGHGNGHANGNGKPHLASDARRAHELRRRGQLIR